ncbi:MAG: HDOD domain-containing protein [Desulfobacteraceae bacterium]|nr:HDOD domain-containing protein [Desulfobacteraceae bacterium]
MKILVVDDEAASRVKMQTLMGTFGVCHGVNNGQEAITAVEKALEEKQPFQMITLDIEMPDLDGVEVLLKIRQCEADHALPKEKRAKIIMVTGQADRNKVMACIQGGCDDYIAKPFNIQLLRAKMEKFGLSKAGKPAASAHPPSAPAPPAKTMTADTIFEDINRALRKGDLELPAQPEVSIQFRQLVAANADIEEIAKALQKDMVIASKVIRMANSVAYRCYGTSITTSQAIGRIGISTTEQIVTALANQRLYATDNHKFKSLLQKLWEHALASAYAADLLAEPMRRDLTVDPFVAGLLHDIGALALIQIMAEMERRRKFGAEITPQAIAETVRNYHIAFGGKLLQKWNFSFDYVQTTQNHKILAPDAMNKENCIVHLSNLIAKFSGYDGMNSSGIMDLAETPSAKHLQLTNPQINDLIQQTKGRMENSGEMTSISDAA